MYIPRNALSGSRRSRLVNGGLLTLITTVLGAALTAAAVNSTDAPLSLAAFASTALSAWLLTWWCVRFCYVNYRAAEGAEPPEDPSGWPWLVAPAVLAAILLVTGFRALRDGETGSAIGSFVFGGFLLLVAGLLLFVQLSLRAGRRAPDPAATAAAQPQHPRRAWGSIDRG
ncbi:hypothetical protein G5C51_34395 [Streptomyces sp. A7024]|uniref:Uncharacterized protein n=1 Tax=Streptomyces coryli TaxID=1128680 RepID=A0A6G4UBA6_9ACTN|nr:hypothetical protein [Streptomyces coryli]NGN68966.1 hypothetical protein [Streptomyces coryli]